MRKVALFLTLSSLLVELAFGQTKNEKDKAIYIIENLYYEEFYLGVKCYNKLEIAYTETDDRLEINEIAFLGEDRNFKTKTSFYLDDIDLDSMKYDLAEVEPGLFFVIIQIDALGNSIEVNTVSTNKDEFPFPVSDSKYVDKLILSPSGKSFPKRLAEKFVENSKTVLGANGYKKAALFKF